MEIPVEINHECDNFCKTVDEIENTSENTFTIHYVPNPDYDETSQRCNKYGDLTKYSLYLGQYPKVKNKILNLDEIVIENTEIDIKFNFYQSIILHCLSPHPEGFTRKNILDIIYRMYQGVYEKEDNVEDFYFQYHRKPVDDLYQKIIDEHTVQEDSRIRKCKECDEEFEVGKTIKSIFRSGFHPKCMEEFLEYHSITNDKNHGSCDTEYGCTNGENQMEVNYVGKVLPLKEHIILSGMLSYSGVVDSVLERLTYYPDDKLLKMFVGS